MGWFGRKEKEKVYRYRFNIDKLNDPTTTLTAKQIVALVCMAADTSLERARIRNPQSCLWTLLLQEEVTDE